MPRANRQTFVEDVMELVAVGRLLPFQSARYRLQPATIYNQILIDRCGSEADFIRCLIVASKKPP